MVLYIAGSFDNVAVEREGYVGHYCKGHNAYHKLKGQMRHLSIELCSFDREHHTYNSSPYRVCLSVLLPRDVAISQYAGFQTTTPSVQHIVFF